MVREISIRTRPDERFRCSLMPRSRKSSDPERCWTHPNQQAQRDRHIYLSIAEPPVAELPTRDGAALFLSNLANPPPVLHRVIIWVNRPRGQ